MMKIGIVTEFKLSPVNYGNCLQAFALNRYLTMQYPEACVETFLLDRPEPRKYTSIIYWMWIMVKKCLAKCKHIIIPLKKGMQVEERFQNFTQFAQQYIHINEKASWRELNNQKYDVLITGSDVVWFQWRGFIRRIKFLDFSFNSNTIKISYAASFGKNYIPRENIKAIRNCLTDFKAISVREKSAVELLAKIGIHNVFHVCDSTLLLEKNEWMKIERMPSFGEMEKNEEIVNNFCFAYLLGQNKEQRERAEQLCKQKGLYLVTVPYISGYKEDGSDCFGDIQVNFCSPQEWVWLIHHAQYVITDSFHGLVFSTIFSSKFIVVKRASSLDLNIRLTDYLSYIQEEDKYVDISKVESLSDFNWDFVKLEEQLSSFRRESVKYLENVLNRNTTRSI